MVMLEHFGTKFDRMSSVQTEWTTLIVLKNHDSVGLNFFGFKISVSHIASKSFDIVILPHFVINQEVDYNI